MFIATFIFAGIYLVLYPGMGAWKGVLGWTSVNELERDQEKALATYEETFGVYMDMPVEELAQDPKALKMGTRLFANNCAVCHGSDGGGNFGFPNLRDNDWLYGGTPEKIKETLVLGRQAAGMAAWGDMLGEDAVVNVSEYVLKLGGREHDEAKAELGKEVWGTCAACHGADGKGNQLVGAPNLTDDIWLYDGSPEGIRQSVRNGRAGVMPAQADKLREDKIHLLTAYVYSLSQDAE
jgi:cytochrome c oxidase cbb3-type subunit 3